jgi:hypothetical protein
MPAFFSGILARMIIAILGTLIMGVSPECKKTDAAAGGSGPLVRCVTVTSRSDTTKAARIKQEIDSLKKEAEALKKEGKPLRIKITDKGLKIGTDEGEEIEFTVDLKGIEKTLLGLEEIEDSIYVFGVDDDDREYIEVRGHDLVRFGEHIHVPYYQLVRGNVVIIGGDLRIDGKVMGDVVNIFGSTTLSSSAIVNGEVVTVMGSLKRSDDAVIGGETILVGGESFPVVFWPFATFGSAVVRIIGRVITFVVMALLLLIVVYFLRDRMKRASTLVFGSFLKSLGVGFLVVFVGSILVLVVAVILAITIIGIPVSILLILSLIALIVIGYFVSALSLGEFLCTKLNIQTDSPIIQSLLGLFALAILGLIASVMFFNPFLMPVRVLLRSIGAFVNFIAVLAGVGAFVLSRAGNLSRETKPELPE